MGHDIYFQGIVEPDEMWKQMKTVWESCVKAGIDVPREVYDYFKGEVPHKEGVRIEIFPTILTEIYETTYRIDPKTLPKDIKYIEILTTC